MATIGAIAVRRAEAMRRLDAATATLQERFSLDVPPLSVTARDPDLRHAQQLEDMATLLEAIVDATPPQDTATDTAADTAADTKKSGKKGA